MTRCTTCTRTRLPLITTSDGVTRCYPCMCLDGHPLVGSRLFVPPESLAHRGWGLGDRRGMTWGEVKAAVADGAPRDGIVEA